MHELSFFSCQDLDRRQVTVHGVSGETDDILLKASIDPPLSACRGLAAEGMGKGHMHVDFFTACTRVRAYKRTRHWRRHKDL